MIPLGDDNSARVLTPYVNWIFIVINILVFIFLQAFGTNDQFTFGFSAVPAELVTGRDLVTDARTVIDPLTGRSMYQPGLEAIPYPVWITLITSIFMHGGFMHLAGNMLYLLIFGDNIENRLGHSHYLFFYLLTGVIATACHVVATFMLGLDPLIPSLGASGAISGVLGGYLLLFPINRVRVFFFPIILHLPAIIVLGLWIVFQIVSGLGMLGGEETGIAYAAHIGGFIAGFLMVKVFDRGKDYYRRDPVTRYLR